MKKIFFLVMFLPFILFADDQLQDQILALLPVDSTLVGLEDSIINESLYHHVTFLLNDEIYYKIFDETLNPIDEKDIPTKPFSKFSDEILNILNNENIPDSEEILTLTALKDPEIEIPKQNVVIEQVSPDMYNVTLANGENILMTTYEVELMEEEFQEKIFEFNHVKAKARIKTIEEFASHNGMAGENFIKTAIEHESRLIPIPILKGELRSFLDNNEEYISSIELYDEPQAEIANAMQTTYVNPYVLNYPARQGNNVGLLLVDKSCPEQSYLTRYHQYAAGSSDSSHIKHGKRTTGIARAASPLSYLYCKPESLPTATELEGIFWNVNTGNFPLFVKKPVNIVSMSLGNNRFSSTYSNGDRDADQMVYESRVAIFKSAGNDGTDPNGYVSSPGKGYNVITVGNYCRAGQSCNGAVVSNHTINSSSSWGNPVMNNLKPEMSAPGTSIVVNGLTASTGTSYAAPHAAAIAADLMGINAVFKYNPTYLKDLMLIIARDLIMSDSIYVINKGGVGGINLRELFYKSLLLDGEGELWKSDVASNAVWNQWDSNDPYPNNGYVDWTFNVPVTSTEVSVALSWLNRGDYTQAHQNDAYPLGIDLDLYVYAPDGTLQDSSVSRYNGYELIRFTPNQFGTYRIKISKAYLRDTASAAKFNMSLLVNVTSMIF